MPLKLSHRPTRELPLLVLTVVIVGAICVPIWQGLSPNLGAAMWSSWSPERWGRLLFGPEQIACYCCFTWGCLILFSRYAEVRRQRRSFKFNLLPTKEGDRILVEDARPLQRKSEQVMQDKGPFILGNMIRLALGKFILMRSSKDASEAVRTQAEVDLGRLVSTMATVHYLAWAIPAIGFLGTVRGLAGSLTMAGHTDLETAQLIHGATEHLNVAFDSTLIALVLSLGMMFLLHSVQREEEALVIDCQSYCTEHLVNRLYEPEALLTESSSGHGSNEVDYSRRTAPLGSRGTKLTP
ncbi:MAG: MotA/TolQ/ExbB proton channel family protein [Gemmataceae bacterium]